VQGKQTGVERSQRAIPPGKVQQRELDGFVLTIAKSGIKFKENTSGEERPVIFPPEVPLPPGIITTGEVRP
jgi:hypothetical protein